MVTERGVLVRLRANADQFNREILKARAAVKGLANDVDTTNDRTAWLAQGILAVGPAAITAGATAIPVLAGLATQAVVGAGAVATMVLAFQGVGDAMSALNAYELDPTVENLAKVNEAMEAIGPNGEHFVRVLDDVGERLSVLKDASQDMFPGMEAGLEALLGRLPDLRAVVSEIATGVGRLSQDLGEGIAGEGMDDFFNFLKTDAQDILVDAGRALGNFAKGFGDLLVAFAPLTRQFSNGLLDMSRGFSAWADGLDQTKGFQDFMGYVRDNGPDVLQLLSGFGDLFVELAKAAAPVGAVMVPALEALADVLSMIADTPGGSLLILGAALTSLGGRIAALRSIAGGPVFGLFTKDIAASGKAAKTAAPTLRQLGNSMLYAAHSTQTLHKAAWSYSKVAREGAQNAIMSRNAVTGFAKAAAPAAAKAGLLVAAMSPLPEKLGLSNTAMGAMVGMIGGPWGIAAGAAVGLGFDIADSMSAMTESIEAANAAITDNNLDALYESLVDLSRLTENQNRDKNLLQAMLGLGPDSDDYAAKLREVETAIVRVTEAERKSEESTRAAARWSEDRKQAALAAEEFRKLGEAIEAPTLSLKDFMAQLRNAGKAAADQAANIRTALKNGLDPEVVREIIDQMGPAAALVFQDVAKGGEAAAARLNQTWYDNQDGIKSYEQAVNDVATAIRNTPAPRLDLNTVPFDDKADGAVTDLRILDEYRVDPDADLNLSPFRKNADDAKGILSNLDASGAQPNITLRGLSAAERNLNWLARDRQVSISAIVGGSLGNIKNLLGFAAGGTVPDDGRGYRDFLPYNLAPREEVITNRDGEADTFRPELKDINAGLSRFDVFNRMMARGLADGGTTGAATPAHVPATAFTHVAAAATSRPSVMTDPAVLARLAAIEAAVNRNTGVTAAEHRDDRNAARRGSSNAATSKQGGYMWAP